MFSRITVTAVLDPYCTVSFPSSSCTLRLRHDLCRIFPSKRRLSPYTVRSAVRKVEGMPTLLTHPEVNIYTSCIEQIPWISMHLFPITQIYHSLLSRRSPFSIGSEPNWFGRCFSHGYLQHPDPNHDLSHLALPGLLEELLMCCSIHVAYISDIDGHSKST
jgi:hypothetical protein